MLRVMLTISAPRPSRPIIAQMLDQHAVTCPARRPLRGPPDVSARRNGRGDASSRFEKVAAALLGPVREVGALESCRRLQLRDRQIVEARCSGGRRATRDESRTSARLRITGPTAVVGHAPRADRDQRRRTARGDRRAVRRRADIVRRRATGARLRDRRSPAAAAPASGRPVAARFPPARCAIACSPRGAELGGQMPDAIAQRGGRRLQAIGQARTAARGPTS